MAGASHTRIAEREIVVHWEPRAIHVHILTVASERSAHAPSKGIMFVIRAPSHIAADLGARGRRAHVSVEVGLRIGRTM